MEYVSGLEALFTLYINRRRHRYIYILHIINKYIHYYMKCYIISTSIKINKLHKFKKLKHCLSKKLALNLPVTNKI